MITLETMPPLMFGGLVVAMLIGFPVAFTLAAVGLSFGFLAIHLGFFDLNFLQAISGRIFGSVLSNELLLAIPFFTFMGAILDDAVLPKTCWTMGQLFGPIRGGHRLSAGSVRAGGVGRADQADGLGAPRAEALDRGGQETAASQRAGDRPRQQARPGLEARKMN